MSRIAKAPVTVPAGVEISISGQSLTAKGKNGQLTHEIHPSVTVEQAEGALQFAARDGDKSHCTGWYSFLVGNMVTGVSEGFKKKLTTYQVSVTVLRSLVAL